MTYPMPNVPGHSDMFRYEHREIRMVLKDDLQISITVAPTNTAIELGTVMGMVTDTQQFIPYKNDATDGSEVARVILAEPVMPSTVPQNVAAYVEGIFYKNMIIGLDDAAIADLKAREPIPNMLIVS